MGKGHDGGLHPNMKVKNLIVIVTVLTVLGYWALRPRPHGAGDRVPDFTLNSIDGEAVSLRDFRGKTVFIEFFNTWCPVCRTAFPQTGRLASRFAQDPGVVFIAVNRGESRSVVKGFLERYQKDWPVLLDPDRQVYKKIFSEDVPAFVIIDPVGRLAYQGTGWWTSSQESIDILAREIEKAKRP